MAKGKARLALRLVRRLRPGSSGRPFTSVWVGGRYAGNLFVSDDEFAALVGVLKRGGAEVEVDG